ncbi:uncharacterized protein [Dysidea avara]|uniref:uncharacterized protein n=1 Tax=Dysidea avara TaxID=196820 RepID=UPI00332E79B5
MARAFVKIIVRAEQRENVYLFNLQRNLKRYNDACDKISELSSQIVSKINICVPSQATSSTCVPQTSSRVCTGEKRSAEAATLDNDEEESVSCNETNSVAAATPFSPEVSILVKGRDRTRRHLMTPVRKPFALSLSRRSYNACSEKAVNSNSFQEPIIDSLAFKAKKEMECLNSQPSQLKDSPKALEKFSWNLLSLELKETVPTLWSFLESLLPKAKQKFICFLISMLLKMQCKQLCQVQKAVSMLLYGNGVHKQVFHCLQPFMVTLSVSVTAQAVKQISDRHDADVISWANDILENREVTSDMLPANSTSPIFFMDENHVFFSSSDDVEVSSDVVSSCSNDDSSVGDVSEFTEEDEEDDDDYDLNDFCLCLSKVAPFL